MYARALGTIGIGMVIPLIGIAAAQASFGALTGAPAGPAEFFYFRPTAAQAELACATRSAASALCGEIDRIAWLRQASVWSAAALVLVIAVFLTLAAIAGASRRLNATLFPPLMPLTTLAVAALVFVHGAIITYCVYLFEIANFGQSYWWAPAIVGGGALLGATSLLATLRSANRDAPQPVLGRAVGREDAPKLWAHVDGLADALGAEKPTNILVGLEPTFFATAAPVATPERPEPLDGETLYLSLPLLRLFTKAELNAVLGHELGHFRGGDTDYSMRFAPVYRSLVKAIHALEGDDGRVDWVAAIPGSMILKLMLEAFGRNERRISRDREFEADRAGLEVSNAEGLGLSLAKVAVYAPLWGKTRADNVARINEGKLSPNLSRVFEESARFDVSHQLISDILAKVLTHRISHPTDTHPPIADRYKAAGFDPRDSLTIETLTAQGGVGALLIDDLEALERALTLIEHKVMIDIGAAQAPPEPKRTEPLLQMAYILAASMAAANQRVDPVEIQAAEIIGKRLFQDFDSVSFREVFEHLDELPSFESVAAVLDGGLETGDKKRLLAFLLEIAAADGEISVEERALLNGAAARWNVSRPIELRLPAGRRRRRAARAEKAPKEPPAAAEERALGEGAERGDPAPLGAAKPNS